MAHFPLACAQPQVALISLEQVVRGAPPWLLLILPECGKCLASSSITWRDFPALLRFLFKILTPDETYSSLESTIQIPPREHCFLEEKHQSTIANWRVSRPLTLIASFLSFCLFSEF